MRRLLQFFLLLMLLFFGSSQTPAGKTGPQLLQEAQILFDSARYDMALQRCQQALEQSLTDEPDAAACLLLLGDIFLETGQWDAAWQQYEESLSIYSQKQGPRHLSTAGVINRMGEYYYKKSDYPQAETWYRKALQIRESTLGPSHEWVADGYNNLGNCQVGVGNYMAALGLHRKALSIRQKVLPGMHPDLATSYNNLGNCAYLSGDAAAACSYFEKALTIREKAFGARHPKTAQVLNNLGNVYALMGRQQDAMVYFQRALDIRRTCFGAVHPTVASVLENMADLCFDGGDYIAALDCYRQAYDIQRNIQGEASAAAAALWHSIGLCYQYEGDFDRALSHHLAAEPVLAHEFGLMHPTLGGLYNNLGNCYAGKKEFEQATAFYQKALHVFQHIPTPSPASLALVCNNLGIVCLENQQAGAALWWFNKSVAASGDYNPGARAIYLKNTALALERLHRWPESQILFEQAQAAAGKADPVTGVAVLDAWGTVLCQRGIRTNDTAMLRHAIAVFEESRLRSDSMRVLLGNAGSQQRWLELQFPAHSAAMEACFHLWQLTGDSLLTEKAFALAERNKSIQLLEQQRKEGAEQSAGIPNSLLALERHWRDVLNSREKALVVLQQSERTAAVRSAGIAVAEARQALTTLMHRLEASYPDYFRLKYAGRPATVKEVQQQVLTSGQALLEYFVADSAVFVFVVTPAELQYLRLPRHFPLDAWVSDFRYSLQAYPNAGERAAAQLTDAYAAQAYQLYNAIFSPVQKAVTLPEKLIIVPDGALAYLPFECLLSEYPADNRQFKSHRYLLRDHCFSYAHSASQQLALLHKKPVNLPGNLLAVSPVYDRNKYGLRPLLNNGPEARAVCDMFGGRMLEGAAASIPDFQKEAGQYRMLLLAMHGKASNTVGDMSYIAFSTGADTSANPFLYARDLYTQSIPADLVVLSACETSVGAYCYGQGVISLAKGFFQAGARSVAATLWSVDDARNAELMRLFFARIKRGVAKDEALHQAKRAFLDAHPHDEAHPVYWAAVTVYGDMRPVALTGAGQWWWAVVAVSVLVAGLLWRVGKKNAGLNPF